MNIDQLPIEQQESASYCHSCGELRGQDELGVCLGCGYQLCFMDGCNGLCACTDAKFRFDHGASLSEIDAIQRAIREGKSAPRIPVSADERGEILREIDRLLL